MMTNEELIKSVIQKTDTRAQDAIMKLYRFWHTNVKAFEDWITLVTHTNPEYRQALEDGLLLETDTLNLRRRAIGMWRLNADHHNLIYDHTGYRPPMMANFARRLELDELLFCYRDSLPEVLATELNTRLARWEAAHKTGADVIDYAGQMVSDLMISKGFYQNGTTQSSLRAGMCPILDTVYNDVIDWIPAELGDEGSWFRGCRLDFAKITNGAIENVEDNYLDDYG